MQPLNSFLFDLTEGVAKVGQKIVYDTIDEIIDDEGNLIKKDIRMIFTITKVEDHRIEMVNLKTKYKDDDKKSE